MRLPIFALIFFALSDVAPMAYASKETVSESAAFLTSLSSAKNWKQLISSADLSVAPFFREELSEFSSQSTFPEIQFFRGHLKIHDENGNQIEIRLEKNGTAFLNGHFYEYSPLTPIATEIGRISSISFSKAVSRSFFEFLVPSAFAQNNSGGVATAAYAVASGWAAQQCGNSNLTASQSRTCPLTAVAMAVSNSGVDTAKPYPIDLICPRPNGNGTLDLISKNLQGTKMRVRVSYSSGDPLSVEIDYAPPGRGFKKDTFILMSSTAEADPDDLEAAMIELKKSDSLKTNVCEVSPNDPGRIKYLAALAKNKAIFDSHQNGNEPPVVPDGGHSQQAI